jgi:hypothetical protein
LSAPERRRRMTGDGKSTTKPNSNEKPDKDQKILQGSLYIGWKGKIGLLIFFTLLFILLTYVSYSLWPTTSLSEDGKTTINNSSTVFGIKVEANDARLLLLVLAIGAMGSIVHTATSFGDFSGTRKLEKSWIWWYFLRPVIGAALALILFFVIKAGLLALGSETKEINIFTIAAVSGLAGMFSKQATNKLSDVFDTLFKSGKGDTLSGKLSDETEHPRPEITSLVPGEGLIKKDQLISITGHNFIPESIIFINEALCSEKIKCTHVSTEEINFNLPASEASADLKIKILNPPPGGGMSNEVELKLKTNS